MKTDKPYAAFRVPDFGFFITYRILFTTALQMVETIMAWQVYEITNDKFALGLIGLAEAAPFILTTFIGGYAADRFNRRNIMLQMALLHLLCVVALIGFNLNHAELLHTQGVWLMYAVIGVMGIARGFMAPASNAFFAQVLPRELYGNGATWNSTAWQVGAVAGPAIGGLLYSISSASFVYGICAAMIAAVFFCLIKIASRPLPESNRSETFLQSLTVGSRFVIGNQIVLSALSLDMFAVLFGGAVAMLPAFAKDVLHVGAEGLGVLRAATFCGSVLMGLLMVYFPPFKNAGRNLLIAVSLFGLSIIGFALSESFWWSFAFLFLSGAFDNVSVVIRHTIMQTHTPDHMRGRVAAVNSIFISSSNEIGAFESGAAAKLLGLIPSVIFGGMMTQLVVGITAWRAPRMRKLRI